MPANAETAPSDDGSRFWHGLLIALPLGLLSWLVLILLIAAIL